LVVVVVARTNTVKKKIRGRPRGGKPRSGANPADRLYAAMLRRARRVLPGTVLDPKARRRFGREEGSMTKTGTTSRNALPAGMSVGHWTDRDGRTGCTVLLAPKGAIAGVEVRGGAPGTLGTDALRPGTLIERAHAVLLTGGSVFGLSAATGVLRYLEEQGSGQEMGSIRIPVVVGAVIFDLLVGDPRARPDAEAGHRACQAASREPEMGAVGAGTGASVAKAGQARETRPGGVGFASAHIDDAVVSAIMVANGVGGVWDDDTQQWVAPLTKWDRASGLIAGANTTIGVVATDARLDKAQANRIASIAHDGIARAMRPAHTMYDGDTLFCLASGRHPAPYDAVEAVAADVVARAITAGVRAAQK
jgi:L-aminopeptidase/D-esterase-like protein